MKGLLTNRKRVVLAVLICLFAVSLIYRITHPYKQPKVDSLTYSSGNLKGRNSKALKKESSVSYAEESLIKMDMFLNPPPHSRVQIKDIFSEQDVTDNMGVLSDGSQSEQISGIGENVTNQEKKIEDDLSNLRAFGYMEGEGEKILFIERGKQILLIRKGDRIEGKYLVKDITKTQLILTVVDNDENVYIDLSGL